MAPSSTLNYAKDDLKEGLRKLTGGKGVDIIFDPVGGTYAEAALRSIAWEGRFLVIGFAAGEIPKMPLNLALLKGCDIRGVFWGAWTGAIRRRTAPTSRSWWSGLRKAKFHRTSTAPSRWPGRGSDESAAGPQGDGQGDLASVIGWCCHRPQRVPSSTGVAELAPPMRPSPAIRSSAARARVAMVDVMCARYHRGWQSPAPRHHR